MIIFFRIDDDNNHVACIASVARVALPQVAQASSNSDGWGRGEQGWRSGEKGRGRGGTMSRFGGGDSGGVGHRDTKGGRPGVGRLDEICFSGP